MDGGTGYMYRQQSIQASQYRLYRLQSIQVTVNTGYTGYSKAFTNGAFFGAVWYLLDYILLINVLYAIFFPYVTGVKNKI